MVIRSTAFSLKDNSTIIGYAYSRCICHVCLLLLNSAVQDTPRETRSVWTKHYIPQHSMALKHVCHKGNNGSVSISVRKGSRFKVQEECVIERHSAYTHGDTKGLTVMIHLAQQL